MKLKRFLAGLLAAGMLFSTMPTAAFAEGEIVAPEAVTTVQSAEPAPEADPSIPAEAPAPSEVTQAPASSEVTQAPRLIRGGAGSRFIRSNPSSRLPRGDGEHRRALRRGTTPLIRTRSPRAI